MDLLAISLGDKHLDGCRRSVMLCRCPVVVDEEEVRTETIIDGVEDLRQALAERTGPMLQP